MIFRFQQFELDTERFVLSHEQTAVAIEPLAFDLLVYLIRHRERVVTRDELLQQLWTGKVVSDAALGARLKDARRAVGDSGSRQAVIKTVHGRGYQFVADISESGGAAANEPPLAALDPVRGDIPSIAVLPFHNLGDDAQQAYIGEGIAQDITTALSRIKRLLVISSISTANYSEKSPDLRQIGSEQGVRYVLEGNVRRSASRVRVTARLIEAANGALLWAERYDRELRDIFALQDEITREIVSALDVQLLEGEQARFWSSGTTNLQAWEYVRQGASDALGANPETKMQARVLFEKALALDPDYAIAWVMLGWIHQFQSDVASGANDPERMRCALDAMLDCAHKALAADPQCADAHGLMAMYQLEVKDFDAALAAAQQAIALAPNNAENLSIAALICNKTGNPERGLEFKRRAMRVCPMYRPGNLRGLGLSYYLLGQHDEAIRLFRESIEREPDYLTAHTYLAAIHGERGDAPQAEACARQILRLSPEFSTRAYIDGLSFSDPAVLARIAKGLRLAGLPA